MLRLLLSLVLLCLVHFPARADERLPAYLIGLPASIKTAFVAETSAAAFHRFSNRNGQAIYAGESYMSIGQNGDGKQRTGDRRTPLGIYFVTEQLDTERMHEKYGITAFVLDYPNTLDKQSNKTGDGIWLHGVDSRGGQRPRLDTDGCLALPNEELALIEPLIEPNTTPVIIGQTMKWLPKDAIAALRAELEGAVADWSDSLAAGDMHTHVSMYGEDFRHWEMNKSEWMALVLATSGSRPITAVDVSDLLLLADPVENELYLSRFKLTVTEGSRKFVSTKRLYWRRSPSGALRIIAEDVG